MKLIIVTRKLIVFHVPSFIIAYILYGAGDGQLCRTEGYFACFERHKKEQNFSGKWICCRPHV